MSRKISIITLLLLTFLTFQSEPVLAVVGQQCQAAGSQSNCDNGEFCIGNLEGTRIVPRCVQNKAPATPTPTSTPASLPTTNTSTPPTTQPQNGVQCVLSVGRTSATFGVWLNGKCVPKDGESCSVPSGRGFIPGVISNGQCVSSVPLAATPSPGAPTSSQQQNQSPACRPSQNNNLGFYAFDTFSAGATLGAVKVFNSVLSSIPVVGFLFEPGKKISEFIFDGWIAATVWGIIGGFLAAVATGLIDFALNFNSNILSNNSVISTGYNTILTLVNMAFVVAIIVIALGTMLRREEWADQKSLPRLILAMILINFSLFFAGILINVSNELTKAFMSGFCPGDLNNPFNIADVQTRMTLFIAQASGGGYLGAITSLLSGFFAAAIVIIGALTLFAIFIFLMIRYVALTVLLVFMPLIWLGLIFPKLDIPGVGNPWGGWWKEFNKWLIFGPVMTFFLYLTVVLINNFKSLAPPGTGDPYIAFGQVFAVVIISLAGLFTANKMGGIGSAVISGGLGAGLGFAAGQWGGLLQKQHLAAETRAKLSTGRWKKFHEFTSGTLKGASEAPRLILGKPLGQVGLKLPEVKKQTEGEKREQRAKHLLGMLGGQPPAVLQLASGDITEFSRHGSPEDKDKINSAMTRLVLLGLPAAGPLTPQQQQQRTNYTRIRNQIAELTRRGEW